MVTRRHRTVFLVGVLLTVLVACSEGSGGKTETDASPEPKTKKIKTAVQLGTLCSDFEAGHPAAARYSGNGPHQTATFFSGHRSGKDVGRGWRFQEDLKFGGLPNTVKTTPVSDIALLACAEGTPGEKQQRDTCEYTFAELGQQGQSAPQSYPLYSQTFSYTVYELRTGRVVKTTTRTSEKGCPTGVVISAGGSENLSKVYAQLSRWDTASALRSVVEGSAQ